MPFSRSYWVEPGWLLAGCYSGDPDPAQSRVKLSGLIAAGIRHIVSLMPDDERSWDGSSFRPYAEYVAERGVAVSRWPIADMKTPTRELMASILDHSTNRWRRAGPSTSTAGAGGAGRAPSSAAG